MGFSLSYKPLYHAKYNAQRKAYVPKFLCPYEFISNSERNFSQFVRLLFLVGNYQTFGDTAGSRYMAHTKSGFVDTAPTTIRKWWNVPAIRASMQARPSQRIL